MAGEGQAAENSRLGWVPYDRDDRTYFGARAVVEEELDYIRRRRPGATLDDLTGVAISGGGIRSASFGLGVLQALAHAGRLSRIDYLSTVSGGGYIGSSLTWLLHKEWEDADGQPLHFGTGKKNFPYGTDPIWSPDSEGDTASDDAEVPARNKGAMLRYLRQHACYLTPGHGITLGSLLAVVLRGAIVSLVVYFTLVAAFLTALLHLGLFGQFGTGLINVPAWIAELRWPLLLAGAFGGLFVIWSILHSVLARWFWYGLRRVFERWAKWLIYLALAMLIFDSLPLVTYWLQSLGGDAASSGVINLTASPGASGVMEITGHVNPKTASIVQATEAGGWVATLFGLGSTVFGVVFSALAFFKTRTEEKGVVPLGLLVGVGAIALLYGLLFLAFQVAAASESAFAVIPYPFESPWWVYPAAAAIFALLVGAATNINYLSLHRYYRDRLTDSFLPDVQQALTVAGGKPGASRQADRTRLQDIWWLAMEHNAPHHTLGPYHLINANVVLVESKIPKFLGRGGDNFILSPRYCGSNATGWRTSDQFMGGGMPLATAMAISGAAINPNTGTGGHGVTRNKMLSMLMGLLNIRLGYWASNPSPALEPSLQGKPNLLRPGLWDFKCMGQLDENSPYLGLTDGGHFENLGLYELIRRKLRFIVVCDGSSDRNCKFDDLGNAIEKVRADFGTMIDIDCDKLHPLVPQKRKEGDAGNIEGVQYAQRAFILTTITYSDGSQGTLLYINTTFTPDLTADLFAYKREHPEFPEESTGDQFFDESQFEAYRELGFQTTWAIIRDLPAAQSEDGPVIIISEL